MNDIIFGYLDNFLDKPVVKLANNAISFSDVIVIAAIFAVAYAIYLGAKVFLSVQVKRKKIRNAQGRQLLQLFGYLIFIAAVFYAAKSIGYPLGYVLLGSTALLVGLGFGLQQLFLDLVSGVILLIDQNVNIGDVVVVDIASSKEAMQGKISHIGLRTTLLQTIDNQFNIIPNSKFLASGVRSLMRDKGSARFRIHILVEFEADMEKARSVMTKAVLGNKNVDQDPDKEPTIIIKDFMDNGVLLEIRFWMKELFNSEIILSDIRFLILEEFKKNGISIPYPQRVMRPLPTTSN